MTRPALLLLPGLLCDAALWQHQTTNLADLAEIYVADLTRHDSMEALAQSVLDTAPPRFMLTGLSMGGYVALEIMRRAPDRVSALVLADTSARPDSPEAKEKRKALLALSESGKFKGVTPRLLPQLVKPDHADDPAIGGVVLEMAARVGPEAFRRQQTAIMNRADSRPSLGAIACPTLVLVGADDALTPPEIAEELAAGIKGARLAIIPDSGHLPPLEQPEAVNREMRDFLCGIEA